MLRLWDFLAGAVLLNATEATQIWLGNNPAFNLLEQAQNPKPEP